MKKALLTAFLWSLVAQVWAAAPFRDDRPESYTVVKGDTLWDISARFLENPWQWPEVWSLNPQINNPHLIYPGDVVTLIYVEGKPRLTVSRGEAGRTIRLGPKIRSTPLENAIPAIPLDAISSFLDVSRVISGPEVLLSAPYILANGQEKVISGAGDTVYVRGNFDKEASAYGAYRGQKDYRDPRTGEYLGTMVQSVGALNVQRITNDIATMHVTRANEELRVGDRLLVSEERRLATSFYPAAPKGKDIEGTILDVIGGVSQIGLYNNVLINLGAREGLEDGSVLAIFRQNTIRDKKTGEIVRLPAVRVGHIMVFRTYEKMSFAIVMQASQPLHTGDVLRAP
ncbi:LysM peptidoglycan-binding domain-containing protein [Sansalvadorimonas verongulae]|uniref:LysM peptidoglycan-binding domain-containing protein n=1 Tax=Sansalvadorimonas verongulae TaxID=2172824 RepID=UPI0012BD5D1A|nr:LysM peptidoglycan-binding domain-containing protein [Sansalvadorimonas verongulae]MTI14189.1 LysM peptidoglycan-binding domain-containing protein [Sansalvadorimonas verongulae]